MKILKLRFKNLNSLYGEWLIDFSAPEYVSDGIFALTGPTGVGKSTILDAICLALYGATPRLGSISASSNEIMSRQTAECYSEVVFESQQGTFICHWEQRRARKKVDGNLQSAEHQIAYYTGKTGNKIIEDKISKVSKVVAEKTGLEFAQFTRAILLAQGSFDNFLKANKEDKSKILEQITGTDIYSKISILSHSRKTEEQKKLRELEVKLGAIEILNEEQISELLTKKKELSDEKIKSEKALQKLDTEIAWQTGIERLKSELETIQRDKEKVHIDIEEFKPKRELLTKANKAIKAESSYSKFLTLEKAYNENIEQLEKNEAIFPEIETEIKTLNDACKLSEATTEKAKGLLETAMPLIRKITSHDENIKRLTDALAEAGAERGEVAKTLEDYNKKLEAMVRELEAANEAEKEICAYLDRHNSDEELLSGLTGFEEQHKKYREKASEAQTKKSAAKELETEIGKLRDIIGRNEKSFKEQESKLKEAEKAFNNEKCEFERLLNGKTVGDYRVEKDALLVDLSRINKREGYEQERKELESGEPCPLCGALEHPFAKGLPKERSKTEEQIEKLQNLIAQLEEKEKSISANERAVSNLREKLSEAKSEAAINANKREMFEKALAQSSEESKAAETFAAKLHDSLAESLGKLGYTKEEVIDDQIIAKLKKRKNEFEKQNRKKAEIEKQIIKINGETMRYKESIENTKRTLKDKDKKIEKDSGELSKLTNERMQLYGNKDPGKEEKRLNSEIKKAEDAEKALRAKWMLKNQEFTALNTEIKSLKNNLIKQKPELETAKSDFINKLATEGFSDLQNFIDSRLPQEEIDNLTEREKILNENKTAILTREIERKTLLNEESAKNLTQIALWELKEQHKLCSDELESIKEKITQILFKIKDNDEKSAKNKDLTERLTAQKEEYKRWDMLYELIGSPDGKKFRGLAQEFAFEILVAHANAQMIKMSDRYHLQRDKVNPLQLCVIDNYQSGEIRPTSNLSGGESFIVCLALALGLSKMASQRVRVDSLFLDEGFGTLDEKSLSAALSSLAALNQDGKLIGIISHVAEIKARINTQINISPASGGKSRIEGPGCQMLSS